MVIGIRTPYDLIIESLSKVLPLKVLDDLPDKWEKIGDVLILRIPSNLRVFQNDIARVYAEVLNCRSVLNEVGGITGGYRKPQTILIFGDKVTVTTHMENAVRFRLDPQLIMFSSGNIDERKRMADIAGADEQVVDLFAGIGYFSIPMAVFSKPRQIIACEINPVAYRFLSENVVLNDVVEIVKPVLGDNRNIAPMGWADRVLLGYFEDTKSFLPVAFQSLKKSGGIIHFHDIYPRVCVPKIPFNHIKMSAKKYFREIELLSWHVVKSYAPGIVHVVLDVKVC